jgi:hypothetical protein
MKSTKKSRAKKKNSNQILKQQPHSPPCRLPSDCLPHRHFRILELTFKPISLLLMSSVCFSFQDPQLTYPPAHLFANRQPKFLTQTELIIINEFGLYLETVIINELGQSSNLPTSDMRHAMAFGVPELSPLSIN